MYPTFFFLSIVAACSASNILFYEGSVASYSHHLIILPLVEALVAGGHNVTYFGPYAYSGPSVINEFRPLALRENNDEFLRLVGSEGLQARLKSKSKPTTCLYLYLFYQFEKKIAESGEMMEWVRSNGFDLVLIDSNAMDVGQALAYYWKARVVILNPFNTFLPWHQGLFNIPDESSWLPQLDSTTVIHGYGFWERLSNVVLTGVNCWVYENVYLARIENLLRNTLVPDLADLRMLIKEQTELVFINFNYWDGFARPIPPFVVPVSGMPLDFFKKGPITKDIEEFLSHGAVKDFVYISFGTAAKISSLPEDFAAMFLKSLGEINLKFLLKWENDPPKKIPGNVLVRQWFPQQDVLSHKNIRGFVSQGGQNSLQQAIFNGVPMIILPLFGDQDIAGKFVVEKGLGKLLEFSNFTGENFKESVQGIILDSRFSKNMEKMKRESIRLSSKSLETALFLVERVLAGDDLAHLKPLSVYQEWWVYRSLDVMALVFFVVYGLGGGALYLVVRFINHRLRRGKGIKIAKESRPTEDKLKMG